MDVHGLLIDKKTVKVVLFCMIWICGWMSMESNVASPTGFEPVS